MTYLLRYLHWNLHHSTLFLVFYHFSVLFPPCPCPLFRKRISGTFCSVSSCINFMFYILLFFTIEIRTFILDLLKVRVLLLQSCPTFFNPMDCSPPGSSVHRVRVLESGAISFSGDFPTQEDQKWKIFEYFKFIYLLTLVILSYNLCYVFT